MYPVMMSLALRVFVITFGIFYIARNRGVILSEISNSLRNHPPCECRLQINQNFLPANKSDFRSL